MLHSGMEIVHLNALPSFRILVESLTIHDVLGEQYPPHSIAFNVATFRMWIVGFDPTIHIHPTTTLNGAMWGGYCSPRHRLTTR